MGIDVIGEGQNTQYYEAVKTETIVTNPKEKTESSDASDPQLTENDVERVTYDLKDFQPENREALLSKMLKSMSKVEHLDKIRKLEDEAYCGEVYAYMIDNGKIRVCGGDGYHHKAHAYEKLINASMNSVWSWMPNGMIAKEKDILDQAGGLLKYYMEIDNNIRKSNKKDSIANHVEEAFMQWKTEFQPKRYHFDGRI